MIPRLLEALAQRVICLALPDRLSLGRIISSAGLQGFRIDATQEVPYIAWTRGSCYALGVSWFKYSLFREAWPL